ncbi:MAG TPA: PqqD family protein [Casimicrobiaceae bacterium]|nr:PqqD family protein [Casimicrobiaceae bacterium]
MSGERYISRSTRVAARMIGDEMMIMSGVDSSLFTLNATASALWQAADGTTPIAAIVEREICGRFDVEHDVAVRDADELIDALAAHGILRVADTPFGAADPPVEETR